MIPGIIVTIPGTLPGMVPVGDSVGAGVASTPVGAVLGTVRHGVITARVTGVVIMADFMEVIGDTITTIITRQATIAHPVDIVQVQIARLLIGLPIVLLL